MNKGGKEVRNKKAKFLILVLVLMMVMIPSLSLASNEKIGDDVVNELKSGKKGIMGDGVIDTVSGLSRDIFQIVKYIVIAYLVIKGFAIFSQFSNAGDNPQLKASLKSRLLWTAIGLILAINFWPIYNFISNGINLGK